MWLMVTVWYVVFLVSAEARGAEADETAEEGVADGEDSPGTGVGGGDAGDRGDMADDAADDGVALCNIGECECGDLSLATDLNELTREATRGPEITVESKRRFVMSNPK